MDLVPFFLGLHAATHAPERWLDGLSEAQMRARPRPEVNSIVWLLWHMARTEGVAVNLVVAAHEQVLDDAWARRMRVARRDMGTGMTSAEVDELTVQALRVEAWDEILTLADTRRAAAVGAFGPNDDWVDGVGHRPWQGHPRGHQLGQTAIRHNTGHIGEVVTVRSLAGLGLGI